jgi:hypothetical protein
MTLGNFEGLAGAFPATLGPPRRAAAALVAPNIAASGAGLCRLSRFMKHSG